MTALPDRDLPVDAATSRPVVRLRDRLREQTNAAILDATEATVTEQGTALAKIDAIALAAGVSVGTLYNHFADRDALIAAVIEDRRRALLDELAVLIAAPGLTFTAKLHEFFVVFAAAGDRHGAFFAVVMGEQGRDRSWQCRRDETIAAWLGLARALLQQGADEGVLHPDRLDSFATILMGFARLLMMRDTVPLPRVEPAELARFFLFGACGPGASLPDDAWSSL